jgi:hypothetical protein
MDTTIQPSSSVGPCTRSRSKEIVGVQLVPYRSVCVLHNKNNDEGVKATTHSTIIDSFD